MNDPAKQSEWEKTMWYILSILPDDSLLWLSSYLTAEIPKNPPNIDDLKRGLAAVEEEIDARLAP